MPRRDLGPQKLPHLSDLWADGFQGAGPAVFDEFMQGACGHEKPT